MIYASSSKCVNCPSCGYKKALSISIKDGKELYYCHAGCSQSDVLSALCSKDFVPLTAKMHSPLKDSAGIKLYAEKLWQEGLPAKGTLAEVYLSSRGLVGALPPSLRFLAHHHHRPTGSHWPIMLASVSDCFGRLQAVHRTYLLCNGQDKAPVTPAKMTLGPVGGFACHLAPAAQEMAVSEGIETGLSVQAATSIPTWAALSAGGIRNLILPPLPLASSVIIAADADPVGKDAAYDAAFRWSLEGRKVRMALPPLGMDFNDLLQRKSGTFGDAPQATKLYTKE